MIPINSKAYWSQRFLTDWKEKGGPEQSRCFYRMALQEMPDWLTTAIRRNGLTVCDWGCAFGDGADILCHALGTSVTGIDFSEVAIAHARETYSKPRFVTADLLTQNFPETWDVVFSSNTLEHFAEPWSVLRRISKFAKSAVVVLVPYRELERHVEHEYTFLDTNIPLGISAFELNHVALIDASVEPAARWLGQQILLVYTSRKFREALKLSLSDLRVDEDWNSQELRRICAANDKAEQEIVVIRQKLVDREGQIVKLQGALEAREEILRVRDGQIASLQKTMEARDGRLATLDESFRVSELARTDSEQRAMALQDSTSWKVTAPLRLLSQFLRDSRHALRQRISRLLDFKHSVGVRGAIDLLSHRLTRDSAISSYKMMNLDGFLTAEQWPYHCTQYGVVFLPIIEWDFRFQRPQQLARQFARNKHPVLYASLKFGSKFASRPLESGILGLTLPGRSDANVYKEIPSQDEIEKMVSDLRHQMEEGESHPWVCLVQLPYWALVAERLKQCTRCYVIYDCMDDHAGFSTNGPMMLAAEERLIQQADLVLASSRPLLEKIEPHAGQAILVRNAVDYDHFGAVPKSSRNFGADLSGAKLTIGYYGAIADWFDSKMVADLAALRSSWNFVLIGSTFTGDSDPLKASKNIELLGEKEYRELPSLIKHWDCCIIPFKRLPLTEATNPVKIYEMLAAGKPVVSVGLPELRPIAEAGHIALADNAVEFAAAIEREVRNDTDELQASRRKFAKENTWEVRQRAIDDAIRVLYPPVSIVIVTYNNLALNRLCLESVLNDTDYPNYEVIVVDNGSSDETRDYLESLRERDVTVILNQENRGFSAANNQGLACARGEYLCLLNNDTVVTGSWLSTLVAHLRAQPQIGLVGPVTNAIGNQARIPVGYRSLLDMPRWAKQYCRRQEGQLQDISMLAFFCIVMPREVFARVGALDERFGLGMFEDDDYNQRVRLAGYEIKLARDSFIHHWQRASFKIIGEEAYTEIYKENDSKFRAKWGARLLKPSDATKISNLLKASEWAKGVVIFAPSIGWSIDLFQRPHHLARALAQDGYVVVFDCSNSDDDVALLSEIEPRLFLFKGDPDLLRVLPSPVLWTFSYNYDYRDYFPVHTPVIYDWIDDLSVFPHDQAALRRLHKRAMREATVVTCVARKLHDSATAVRRDALYLPNAVEAGHFERVPTPNPALKDKSLSRLVSSGRPIAGYYGALARWFDYELMEKVAQLRPDWNFVLIGPDHDGSIGRSGIDRRKNIFWLGPRAYEDLPGYLDLFRVAMIPFKINEITFATSPLKLFEYFAGGKPVVTTPMPECTTFPEVRIASTPDEFASALDEARNVAEDPAFLGRLAALAKKNTWQARAHAAMSALSTSAPAAVSPFKIRSWESPAREKSGANSPARLLPAPIPQCFRNWQHLDGQCNICGQTSRFFFEKPALYREQLVCEHCGSTSRYRSIARGLLEAIKETAGMTAESLAELPHTGVGRHVRIYDTQPPFKYEICAYPIPEHLRRCDWIELNLSAFKPDLPQGAEIAVGVINQNLERLTFPGNHFDIVITSDVMEHVRLDAMAHAEISRVLRPGGIYIFTVPHNWDWELNLIRVRVDDPKLPETDIYVLEPEYHGDANSSDGSGVLAYRAYGRELKTQLENVGLKLRHEKMDLPGNGILNTELFYCRKIASLGHSCARKSWGGAVAAHPAGK